MDETALSRSGTTSPFGKNDRRLDLLVSEDLENAVIAMATLRGVPKGEFVRSVLERFVFGEFSMVQKIANRDQ